MNQELQNKYIEMIDAQKLFLKECKAKNTTLYNDIKKRENNIQNIISVLHDNDSFKDIKSYDGYVYKVSDLYQWCIDNADKLALPKEMLNGKDDNNKRRFISAVAGYDYISKKNQLLKDYSFLFDKNHIDRLKSIEYYKLHPEWIPFVGSSYEDRRVLLVGESHYVDSVFDLNDYDFENRWYKNDYNSVCKNIESSNDLWVFSKSYFWTQSVIATFANDEPGAGYAIFANPLREIGLLDDKKNIKVFAYMNYFQRPSNWGAQLYSKGDDKIVAYDVLKKVVSKDNLAPNTIIFLSKNAFDCFAALAKNEREYFDGIKIYKVHHPNCAWWNIPKKYKTKSGKDRENKYGKEHFVDAYNNIVKADF